MGDCDPVRKILFIVFAGAMLFAGGCASFGGKAEKGPVFDGSGVEREGETLLLAEAGNADGSQNSEAIESTVVDIEPTVVEYDDYRDPLIGVNRAIFAFNDVTYRYALIPLGKGYVKITPQGFRNSVGNFFYNIRMPIHLVNNVFQFKFEPAARNLVRFGINSTLGLFGLFDPAKNWFNLDRAEARFEDTLAHYGAGYGFYLVLPFAGPSDLRGGTSLVFDYFLDPIPELVDDRSDARAIQIYDRFNEFAPSADQYEILREKSEDPYIFFRNLHLQGIQRDAEYSSE
ncbi:MAG TPA: VacJ family lipoprotein [Gammaproteobacteria bacterium]